MAEKPKYQIRVASGPNNGNDTIPTMHETMTSDRPEPGRKSRLHNTMRLIRQLENGREKDPLSNLDVQRQRLSALLNELDDVISDIPDDVDLFSFELSSNHPIRLWIDDTTFVVMAKGNEGYRMLKETRAGRVLLRESKNRRSINEAIVHYVAERLAQYERLQPEDVHARGRASSKGHHEKPDPVSEDQAGSDETSAIIIRHSKVRSFIWFVIGTLFGAISLLAFAWFRTDIMDFIDKIFV